MLPVAKCRMSSRGSCCLSVHPQAHFIIKHKPVILLQNGIITKCKKPLLFITFCSLPEPHQIQLCRNRKYFIQWAVAYVNSQPSVAQEMPFLSSLQVLHHDSSHKPANKMTKPEQINIFKSDMLISLISPPVILAEANITHRGRARCGGWQAL